MPEEAKPQPQPTEQQQQEVRSAVVESFKPGGQETLQATPMAKDLANSLRARYNPEDPTATMKHRRELGIMAKTDTETHLKDNIGTEHTPHEDGDGSKTETGKRMDRARDMVDRVKKLEEVGYDKLKDEEQKVLRDKVLESVIAGRPDFDGLDDADKFTIAETILKDPGAVGKIAETLKGRLENPTSVDSGVNAEVTEAKNAVENTERAILAKDREKRDKKKELSRAKTRQKTVDEQIRNLAKDRDDDRDTRDDLLKKLKSRRGNPDSEKFKDLQMIVAQKVRSGDTLSGDEAMMKEYMDVQGRLDELPKLLDEQSKLPKKIDDLTDAKDALDDDMTDLAMNKVSQEKKLNRALDRRGDQEEQFVTELETSLADGANEWFDKAIEDRDEAAAKKLQEKAAAAEMQAKKDFLTALHDRLYEKKEKHGKVKIKMQKRQIYEDAASIMQYGPEAVTRVVLSDLYKDKSNDSDEVKAQKAQARAMLEQQMQSDSKFMEDMQKQLTNEVLAARTRVGPMFDSEILLLRQQGLEDQLRDAIDDNGKMKKEVENVMNKTGPASTYEALRHYLGADSVKGFPGGLAKTAIFAGRWILSPTFLPEMIKWGVEKYRNEIGREYPR